MVKWRLDLAKRQGEAVRRIVRTARDMTAAAHATERWWMDAAVGLAAAARRWEGGGR